MSSRNRVPRVAEPGEAGEERRVQVELRTVADVGLVGLPNAGKSTLLSRLTAATPKIANYPFTTLTPNLGVAGQDGDRFVVADVPGLIEGASRGQGARAPVPPPRACAAGRSCSSSTSSAEDPAADLAVLRAELAAYDPELAARPAVLVATKADLVDDASAAAAPLGPDAIVVSAVTGEGLEVLLDRLGLLAKEAAEAEPPRSAHVVLRPGRPRFTVSRGDDGRWLVAGQSRRAVGDGDGHRRRGAAPPAADASSGKKGWSAGSPSLGARPGDEVEIRGRVFEYTPDEEG